MSGEPILTVSKASELSGVPVFTLRRLVRSGRVASVKVCGIRRVRLSAISECLEETPRKVLSAAAV
jgi:excisionase family DNA binding protein